MSGTKQHHGPRAAVTKLAQLGRPGKLGEGIRRATAKCRCWNKDASRDAGLLASKLSRDERRARQLAWGAGVIVHSSKVRGKWHCPCRSGPAPIAHWLALSGSTSRQLLFSHSQPWGSLTLATLQSTACILPSRPWIRIRSRSQRARQPVTPEACRCCFLSVLSSASCGGAKTSLGLSCQRWGCRARPPLPELGCYADYRVPRQGIGHMGSPTGRATDAVMILVEGGAMLMFSPSRRSDGIQSLPVHQEPDCRRVGRLPQWLWRFT